MNNELLTIINYLERERGINREVIIQAIESALEASVTRTLNTSSAVKVVIDRKNLAVKAFRTLTVSDDDVGIDFIPVAKARRVRAEAQVGDTIEVEVPPTIIGRIGAQNARQAIMAKIRAAERENVMAEYKDRIGDIVNGTVAHMMRRDLIINIGRAEALLPARERISGEEFDIGDHLRAYVARVGENANGPSVVLSRTANDFLKALFRLEVSEIADGVVEIMSVTRDPGSRAKIAVRSHDDKIDPVGACVGIRGIRVRNIVRELNGEKIDIVRWNEDLRQYVAQALTPARLASIELDEEDPRVVHVTVEPDQLSLAIGRAGQNVKLAARLTGCKIDIVRTDAGISFEERVSQAIENLASIEGITRNEAETLVQNGFLTPEGILAADIPYLVETCDFDEATAARIWNSATANTTPVAENEDEQ